MGCLAYHHSTEYAQEMESNADRPHGNPSHDLDLVTVFQLAEGGIEEMEVLTVRQLLESNGIKTVLIGDSPLPNFAEEVRVAAEDASRARELIAEALAAGPAGAAEAEAESDH
jgi:Putative prokaryotic signal transducing protein